MLEPKFGEWFQFHLTWLPLPPGSTIGQLSKQESKLVDWLRATYGYRLQSQQLEEWIETRRWLDQCEVVPEKKTRKR